MSSEESGPKLCEDYSIAGVLDDEYIARLRTWFTGIDDRVLEIDGTTLFKEISEIVLDNIEQEAVLIGLLQNEAAIRVATRTSLRTSTYRFDVERCITVFDQQRIAARALASEAGSGDETIMVEILATVPSESEFARLGGPRVSPLAPRLRRILLEAEESVRIANPYFDPGQRIIDDIAGLPRKGLKTRILTREVRQQNHRIVFNMMDSELPPNTRQNLLVRELYELDAKGRQAVATHAKIMIIDNRVAYVGSANLTMTSLGTNFELGLLVHGPPVEKISAVFDEVFANARSIDLPIR